MRYINRVAEVEVGEACRFLRAGLEPSGNAHARMRSRERDFLRRTVAIRAVFAGSVKVRVLADFVRA